MEDEKKVYYKSFDDVKLCGILSKVNDDDKIISSFTTHSLFVVYVIDILKRSTLFTKQ